MKAGQGKWVRRVGSINIIYVRVCMLAGGYNEKARAQKLSGRVVD